jgi:hypothetical protein
MATPQDRLPEFICVECWRIPADDEDAADEWRVFFDGTDLHVFCPECAEREFGSDRRGAKVAWPPEWPPPSWSLALQQQKSPHAGLFRMGREGFEPSTLGLRDT